MVYLLSMNNVANITFYSKLCIRGLYNSDYHKGDHVSATYNA